MNLKQWVNNRSPRLNFKLLVLRSYASIPARATLINRYMSFSSRPKLQLGAGRNYLEGWLNTDYFAKHPKFIYLDVRRKFPLPDGAFERVFSEHMIEHISLRDGENMLAESFRVLKPGGKIRIDTPDLEKISKLYATQKEEDAQDYVKWHHTVCGDKTYPATISFAINNIMRYCGHIFLYDREMLDIALTRAGFRDLECHGWNESQDSEFHGISQRVPEACVLYETFGVEGTKPL